MRSAVAILATLVGGSALGASGKVEFFCKTLRTSKDFRVKVNATVGLGSTNDIDAVPCLCDGLDDALPAVRKASAIAINQLADQQSLSCLKRHLDDPDPGARAAISDAFGNIDAQNVKHGIQNVYVWLSLTSSKQDPSLGRIADERLRSALQKKGVQVSPPGQSREQAIDFVTKGHLKGFDLRPELKSSGTGLTLNVFLIQLRSSQLLGQVGATARGPAPPELIKALAPKVVDEAADEGNWSN